MIEKKYLTFNEVLIRWGLDKQDIHYLIAERSLIPSIVWNDEAFEYEYIQNPEDPKVRVLSPKRNVQDEPLIIKLRGIYSLWDPILIGPNRYEFEYVTSNIKAPFESPCYRLIQPNSAGYHMVANIDQNFIEGNAVFMIDRIELCEAFEFDLQFSSKQKSKFVATAQAINSQMTPEKPLGKRERENMLAVIAALATEAKYPLDKISKSADLIADATQRLGASVGATTIENYLKAALEVVRERSN